MFSLQYYIKTKNLKLIQPLTSTQLIVDTLQPSTLQYVFLVGGRSMQDFEKFKHVRNATVVYYKP